MCDFMSFRHAVALNGWKKLLCKKEKTSSDYGGFFKNTKLYLSL